MSLPETATTGYRWQPDLDPGALRLRDIHPEATPKPRGAPGRRVLTAEALRPGVTQLRLHYRRGCEQQPAETFAVELDVRAR